MPQYSFSADASTIEKVDEIAKREDRTRSTMIELLLVAAIKERERNRAKQKRAKEVHTEDQSSDTR